MKLCKHVELDIRPKDADAGTPAIVGVSGAVRPFFGWDVELQADTPRIECSTCGRTARVLGKAIRLKPTTVANRIGE